MQPVNTAADFLAVVRASRLLSAERLGEYQSGGPSVTASAVASRIVRDGLLTAFQAKLLLKGRTQGFFLTDKYKVLDHLGTGGMGRVYLCEHLLLQRLVAVKVLGLAAGPNTPGPAPGVVERFYREARAVAALDHRNIVRVFDVDQTRGSPFMVMEYVDGIDLHQYVGARGPLDPARAADYTRQAADGLQHAHEAGLVHRDVKPGNLLLDRLGVVRLLDLGLVRFLVDAKRNQQVTERYDPDVVLGTADFMAPEQALGSSSVDIRADIYSLGCTLYYLLSGRLVFEVEAFAQKLVAHQMREPTPIRELAPGVPPALDAVLRKMMAKAPADRFQTPDQVSAALAKCATPPPGPPDTTLMPKVAARAIRLGLSPVQGVEPTAPAVPTTRLPPPSRVEPLLAPPETIGQSGTETPSQIEPAPRAPEPEGAPQTEALKPGEPRRRRSAWSGGVAGIVAVVGLAVVLWPTAKPALPDPADVTPAAGSGSDGPQPRPAGSVVPVARKITAGGSTFLAPGMRHWGEVYARSTGLKVEYQEIGSGRGVGGVTAGTLEFGATDAPMTDAQLAEAVRNGREVLHVPLLMGAVVPIYNVPDAGRLRFTGPVLADIYLGKIDTWNHPAIRQNNPGVDLPDLPIEVVHRSDASGTTFIWTDYLSEVSPKWKGDVGKNTSVRWPVGTEAKGNNGVAEAVGRKVGTIGYVELSYAVGNNLNFGAVKNREGRYVVPSFETVTAAAIGKLKEIPDDLRYSLVDAPGVESYPIAGTAWALVPIPKGGKPDPAVVKFLEWATHDGQTFATELGYARIPPNLVVRIDAIFYRLTR